MSYKNILVNVTEAADTDAVLQAAFEVARKSDAHVTGIHVIPHINMPVYVENSLPAGVLRAQEEVAQEAAARAKAKFLKAADQAGCLSDWYAPTGFTDEQIALHARYADLVVIGQEGDTRRPSSRHTIENHVLLNASRPVMVVPYVGFKGSIGNTVLIAWNGSMEATRAVNDAMPLLQKANKVHVLSVVETDDDEDVPGADLCVYLARHDVNAEATRSISGGISTANVLLNSAADMSVDLVVMGAYGHSRLREWVLGGATYNILNNMTIPVLMSH